MIIQTLNSLGHLTPDQIVARLSNQDWVRFRDLTDEQFEFFQNKRMVIVEWNGGFGNMSGQNSGWAFWGNNNASDREYFRTTLRNYWGILRENYRASHLPDRPTD